MCQSSFVPLRRFLNYNYPAGPNSQFGDSPNREESASHMATALQSPNITPALCLSQGDFQNSFKPDHHHLPSKQIHVFERDDVFDGHCAPVDLHDIGGGHIFVRDPPFAELLAQNHSRSLVHIYSQSITSVVVPSLVTPMAKKRRSLQSILIPSFLHSPPSSVPPTPSTRPSRARSHSELIYHPPLDDAASRASPSFLLDDDPFANLSTAPTQVTSPPAQIVSPRITPRSPLSPCTSESANRLASPVRSSPASMSSFPRSHPAHKRPAFAPRPSLPSLHALAQMNAPLVLPRKHRKGKVGAGLPFEPWELGSSTMVPGPPSSMLSPRGQDFTSDLDADFLDFTDDDDDFDDFDDPTASADEQTFQMQPLDIFPDSLSGADSSSSFSRSSSSSRSLSSSSSLSDSEDRSSSRRSDDSKHSASGQPHSSSAESDSDIPNSPPDESYFIFPRSLSPDCLLVDEDHEELDGVGYEIGSGVDVPYHGLDSIYFHHTNSLYC
ncbi:hypothetical protein EYR38_009219 [Pleurotus pulmonarius]|nr:hypothetical protein EYR38_009219 [Pleurotus pulmonarius]